MTEDEEPIDKVKKGLKEVVGGTAGVVEGTAQGIKEAVEDTKEGAEEMAREARDTDMDASSFDETENRENSVTEDWKMQEIKLKPAQKQLQIK